MNIDKNDGIVAHMDHARFADHLIGLASAADTKAHDVLLRLSSTPRTPALSALVEFGITVHVAGITADALQMQHRLPEAILVLELDQADPPGLAQIAQLSHAGGLIVVLHADGDAARVECLSRGADDVVPRHVSPVEVAARIRALHRRMVRIAKSGLLMRSEALGVDSAHRCIIGRSGERTPLSEAEFIALETLLDADGAPVAREWIGRVALKRPMHADDRSVDQLMLKLRRKLTTAGASERTILSARRQGYVISDPSQFRIAAAMSFPGAANPTSLAAEIIVAIP